MDNCFNIIKYILAAIFGLLILTMFLRELVISGNAVGFLELNRYLPGGSDVAASAEAVAYYARRLLIMWILSGIIYLASAIVLLFARGNIVPLTAGIGVFAGCVIKTISGQNIMLIKNDCIMDLTWSWQAFAVWLLLNLAIVTGIIVYLILSRTRETSKRIYQMQTNIIKDGPIQSAADYKEDKHCPKCGNQIEEDTLFCESCGAYYDKKSE